MTKKRWIAAAAVVVVLIAGVTGGTLMAQQGGDDGDAAESKSFAARVAEILGLDTETVEDAINQAKREMFDERVRKKLDAAIAKGLIDQAKADEILEWLAEQPDGAPPWLMGDGDGKKGFRGRGKGGPLKFGWRLFGADAGDGEPKVFTWRKTMPPITFSGGGLAESLEQAVEEGAISREMADLILQRFDRSFGHDKDL